MPSLRSCDHTSFKEGTADLSAWESSLYTLLETGPHMTAGPRLSDHVSSTLVLLLSDQNLETP